MPGGELGAVVASAWGASGSCDSALAAEIMACIKGLEAVCACTDGNLILECDSKVLVEGIRAAPTDRSSSCFMLRELAEAITELYQTYVGRLDPVMFWYTPLLNLLGR